MLSKKELKYIKMLAEYREIGLRVEIDLFDSNEFAEKECRKIIELENKIDKILENNVAN